MESELVGGLLYLKKMAPSIMQRVGVVNKEAVKRESFA